MQDLIAKYSLATKAKPTFPTLQIASRQEVDVQCTSRQSNLGYVPVFQKFHRTISALYLNRIELTQLRNNTFKSLRYVRVGGIGFFSDLFGETTVNWKCTTPSLVILNWKMNTSKVLLPPS